ncbi:MAG: response regulator transcription factor [Firmicutes bacterium]|nr:response regulator transcription factor [Bacillota bacterium]
MVVDDHTLFAEGTSLLLSTESRFTVIGIAKTGKECLDLTRAGKPDVVLLDINLPDICGTDLIQQLKKDHSDVRILVLTGQNPEGYLSISRQNGAHGFLLKDCSISEMTEAILRVASGQFCFSNCMDQIPESVTQANLETLATQTLTPRENEIMGLVAKGLHNSDIAVRLGIKKRTVDTHVGNILVKLNVNSRLEAALAWLGDTEADFKRKLDTQ